MESITTYFDVLSTTLRHALGSTLATAIAVGAFATDCLPFAVPPVRLEGSGGLLAGGDGSTPRTYAAFRASFHPLQLAPRRVPIDVGMGYGVEGAPESTNRTALGRGSARSMQSTFVQLAAYPSQVSFRDSVLRWGAAGAFDLLFEDLGGPKGYGVRVGPALEYTGFADGPFTSPSKDSTTVGFAYGQWALGAFASLEHRSFEGTSWWGGAGGVSVRIPFAVGIACCSFSGSKQPQKASIPDPTTASSGAMESFGGARGTVASSAAAGSHR